MLTHIWSKTIPAGNAFPAMTAGKFVRINMQVLLMYAGRQSVLALSEQCDRPRCIYSGADVEIPARWVFHRKDDTHSLIINPKKAINILNMQVLDCSEVEERTYRAQGKPRMPGDVLWEAQGLILRARGEGGCQCEKDGYLLWTFTGRAYRYTPYVVDREQVIWGTSGHGGYLYIVSLYTGETIAAIKTGGTACFVLNADYCYVLANQPGAHLLCIDRRTGEVIDRVKLKGRSVNSPLVMIGDRLHTITFLTNRDGSWGESLWHCVAR